MNAHANQHVQAIRRGNKVVSILLVCNHTVETYHPLTEPAEAQLRSLGVHCPICSLTKRTAFLMRLQAKRRAQKVEQISGEL